MSFELNEDAVARDFSYIRMRHKIMEGRKVYGSPDDGKMVRIIDILQNVDATDRRDANTIWGKTEEGVWIPCKWIAAELIDARKRV